MEYPDSDRSSRRPIDALDPPDVRGGPRPKLCNLAAFRVPLPDRPPMWLEVKGEVASFASSAIRVNPNIMKIK